MEETDYYEKYPCRIVLFTGFFSLAVYGLGAFLMYWLGLVWLGLYILYVIWLELRLLKTSCVKCYYYGKICAFGKGKLSSLLFNQQTPGSLAEEKITWKHLIPDMLVAFIPVVAGVIRLIIYFELIILGVVVLLLFFSSLGSGFLRGNLACRYCRQRETGCPAEQLFKRGDTKG
ncbi:hypothetical protein ACFLT6_00020 [Chloroflexota bacterium]